MRGRCDNRRIGPRRLGPRPKYPRARTPSRSARAVRATRGARRARAPAQRHQLLVERHLESTIWDAIRFGARARAGRLARSADHLFEGLDRRAGVRVRDPRSAQQFAHVARPRCGSHRTRARCPSTVPSVVGGLHFTLLQPLAIHWRRPRRRAYRINLTPRASGERRRQARSSPSRVVSSASRGGGYAGTHPIDPAISLHQGAKRVSLAHGSSLSRRLSSTTGRALRVPGQPGFSARSGRPRTEPVHLATSPGERIGFLGRRHST